MNWRFVLAWSFILGTCAGVLTFGCVVFLAFEIARHLLLLVLVAVIFIGLWNWSFDYLERNQRR